MHSGRSPREGLLRSARQGAEAPGATVVPHQPTAGFPDVPSEDRPTDRPGANGHRRGGFGPTPQDSQADRPTDQPGFGLRTAGVRGRGAAPKCLPRGSCTRSGRPGSYRSRVPAKGSMHLERSSWDGLLVSACQGAAAPRAAASGGTAPKCPPRGGCTRGGSPQGCACLRAGGTGFGLQAAAFGRPPRVEFLFSVLCSGFSPPCLAPTSVEVLFCALGGEPF